MTTLHYTGRRSDADPWDQKQGNKLKRKSIYKYIYIYLSCCSSLSCLSLLHPLCLYNSWATCKIQAAGHRHGQQYMLRCRGHTQPHGNVNRKLSSPYTGVLFLSISLFGHFNNPLWLLSCNKYTYNVSLLLLFLVYFKKLHLNKRQMIYGK